MKLLATVVSIAAARKDSCTNTPPLDTVIVGMDGYQVTEADIANWSACGPNAVCEKIRGWNFVCACKAGFTDYDVNDYRKFSCYDSCHSAETPENATCDVDSEGNAFWTCNSGYYQATVDVEGSTEATDDVCFFDSCATDPCAANTDCAADGDSHVCSCSAGFFDFNSDASVCVPDNCAAGTGGCDADATCSVDMPDSDGNGQNTCTCNDGFYGNGAVCFVDSCALNPCQEDATCANVGDEYTCTCNAGFYLGFAPYEGSGEGSTWDDPAACHVDVCASANPCDGDATCSNNADGSQTCVCNAGFYGDGNECFVDSCALSPCQADSTCANVGDEYTCTCNAGFYLGFAPYEGSGEGSTWENPDACHVDVCASANPCDADAACSNNADGSQTCVCNAGFYGDGMECFVDSCALSPCQADSTCANVGDEYTCTCNAGFYLGFAPYEGSGEGSTWTDPAACHVDVCASANPCDVDAECTNNDDGSQSCACNDGFYGDGSECFVDSCALNPCQADSSCANVGDEYECTCNAGFYLGFTPYEGSGDGSSWTDPAACHVDVCASANPCDADAACSNNADGTQSCVCNAGFYGNGAECFVDSCALNPCQADSTCANDGDEYTCTCNAGFYLGFAEYDGSGEGSTWSDPAACHVDVCASANPCDVDAECTNNANGSQSCSCDDGFYGDGYECFVDSCAFEPCQDDSTCANVGDDYSCTCNFGFYFGIDAEGDDACHVDICAAANPCDIDAACSNEADGSQTCVCNDGFYGNGAVCFVDSCALSPCQNDSTCANDEDSFTCTCNAGFYLGVDAEGEEACHADICDQANPCDANASCSNNEDGSQTCVCNADFKGDGLSCTDIGLLNSAELTARLADFDADAAGITSTKNVKKFNKAMKKFPVKHVNNYVAECPNKRDVNALIAEREANEIVNEELLGWDISDACSYAKDLATANNRFLKRWSCVSQFGFDFNTKDLKKSNKKLRNKMKKVEKAIVKFSSTVNGLLGC